MGSPHLGLFKDAERAGLAFGVAGKVICSADLSRSMMCWSEILLLLLAAESCDALTTSFYVAAGSAELLLQVGPVAAFARLREARFVASVVQ